MLPHHVALLAQALRPALVIADAALKPGKFEVPGTQPDLADVLKELNSIDTGLAMALGEIAPLIEREACPDADIYEAADSIRAQLRLLIAAYRNAAAFTAGEGMHEAKSRLAGIARDILVAYTHFLAEIIGATAQPWSVIGNGAVPLGNNQFELTLHCKTDMPTNMTELANWIPAGEAYNQAAVSRSLRISVLATAPEPLPCPTPDPAPCPAPPQAARLSVWEILGIAGILSLLTGCDHGE